MGIYRHVEYVMNCDSDCCGNSDVVTWNTRKEAIEQATEFGWTKVGKKWLCPRCAKELESVSPPAGEGT